MNEKVKVNFSVSFDIKREVKITAVQNEMSVLELEEIIYKLGLKQYKDGKE